MGHKVLLADDSITVQKIVKLSLTEEGVEVIAVGNGEQAVQQLETLRPDLVMADVFMPGKDGYEVCEFVKAHPQLKHIPVILLVHAFEPFDPDRAQKVGADHQLTKPFQSIRTLVSTVRDLLQAAPEGQTVSPEPTQTVPTHTAVVTPFPTQPKPREEEFAMVSSLTPAAQASTELVPEPVTMPGVVSLPTPNPLTPAASFSMSEASLPMPSTSMGELLNADLLPPTELSVLSQSGWQAPTSPNSEWQSVTPTYADVAPPASPPDVMASAFPSLASPSASFGASASDDVLELADVLSSVPAPAAPLATLSSQSVTDVPLLAVLSAAPAISQAPEPISPSAPSAEAAPPMFAGSFDLAAGHLPLQPELPPSDATSLKQDVPLGAISQPAATADFPISEALIEEIVNRVIQRLSTNAIQEIAWEVVPEMAELLIRKQISQQKQLAH
jgi:CheY-like chemotaxis protein